MDPSIFQSDLTLEDFLSKMGIQESIIKLLMKRPIPPNNLYWEGQTASIDGKVRFLSIPFWLQLCSQNGYSLELLLQEENLQIMERILPYSEEEEREYIDWEECINKCYHLPAIQKRAAQLSKLAVRIRQLIHQYPIYKSLRRGNFLVYHVLLFAEEEEGGLRLSRLLIDLIICGCVIDDLFDADTDRLTGEENILVELGDDLEAVNEVKTLFYDSLSQLQPYLPQIHGYLEYTFNQVVAHYLFRTLMS